MVDIIKMLTKKKCYPNKNNAKFIVIHETDNEDKGADAKRHAQALNNGNLEASVHYYVDDKVIYQTLDYKDGAWAVGKSYGTALVAGVTNYNSINIEICVNKDGNYTKARENAIDLTRKLMKDLNISADKVIRHYDAKKKYCPRKMLDNPKLWVDFKDKVKHGEGANKMTKYTIVYEGEVDKVLAQIISWNYKKNECRVCDIKDYVPGHTQNLYVIGGEACNKIGSITKEKYTAIKGNDRFDTLYKALDFINR
ncbi:TPA: N-acetylmuramoyl-L-alanine amidase [Clostridioides difficile]|uniref:N-acetylmuramoyl-L-alanine amidase n=1 Tax=Clostridioides difficile TaxID=1496 RepID=A0AB74QH57_CLODI|nr:N-acetylmuramoyl-L-alanine amidase [Clostridioides difficile]AXU73233.1 putative N-acetylmuramoyl-L-alanine amidase [Clostridioides difficile]AYD22742.1 amidase [Clostridioides difficile]EGT3903714.1 amidase [Clostridioides difficile]EGT3942696.1 amidase [Clostridioides difficile]EGT4099273.1 amidase [Clostridioides difficile]